MVALGSSRTWHRNSWCLPGRAGRSRAECPRASPSRAAKVRGSTGEGEVAVAPRGQALNQPWAGWTVTREWRVGKGQGQAVVRDGACRASTVWEQVLPDQPRGAQLWGRARVLQSTCLFPGESQASPGATARSALMGGLALLGSLLPLGPPDGASTTQGASALCQGHLLPTSSAHRVRSWCTGSGRRVSGGLRRWSLGRGCSLAAPRTKPGGGRLGAPTTSLSRVPPHPPPKTSEPLVGRLPRPQPPRWPRQLLHSCSQTLTAS